MACVFRSNRLLRLFSASLLKLVKLSVQISSKYRLHFKDEVRHMLWFKKMLAVLSSGGYVKYAYIYSKILTFCSLDFTVFSN